MTKEKNATTVCKKRWGKEVADKGYFMKPRCLSHCAAQIGLKSAEAAVLDYLFMYWYDYDQERSIFPAHKTIAKALGLGESTIARHLCNLEAKGFLERELRLGNSNIYHLEPTLELIRKHILSGHSP